MKLFGRLRRGKVSDGNNLEDIPTEEEIPVEDEGVVEEEIPVEDEDIAEEPEIISEEAGEATKSLLATVSESEPTHRRTSFEEFIDERLLVSTDALGNKQMKIKVLEVSDEHAPVQWRFGDRVKITKILVTIKHLATQEVEESEFDIEAIERGAGRKAPLHLHQSLGTHHRHQERLCCGHPTHGADQRRGGLGLHYLLGHTPLYQSVCV